MTVEWAPRAWFYLLSEDIQRAAHSLREQHINEDAFRPGDALEALPRVGAAGLVVLGGDFWLGVSSGPWRPTDENWSFRFRDGESRDETVQRSIAEARAAIERRLGHPDWWVTLVCKEQPEDGEGAA